MKIYDRIMGLGTKMTDMDASTYQGAFIGKIGRRQRLPTASHMSMVMLRRTHSCIYSLSLER